MRSAQWFTSGSLLAVLAVMGLLLWTSRADSGPEWPVQEEMRPGDPLIHNAASKLPPSINRQHVPLDPELMGTIPLWAADELNLLEMARGDDRFSVINVEILDPAAGPLDALLGPSLVKLRVLTDDPTNQLPKDAILSLGRSSARRYGVTTPRRTLSAGDVRTVVVEHAVILGLHKNCALLLEGPPLPR